MLSHRLSHNLSHRLLPRLQRSAVIFAVFALIVSFFMTLGLIAKPGYTDAFYYFNAANRLVEGEGFSDPYVYTYIAAPEGLPIPSHLYWMPATSVWAALGMWAFNAPGDYDAAQIPFALMLAAVACMGYWLGGKLGGTNRHRWVVGLLALFNGFYVRYWGVTDNFTPYAFAGTLALIFAGLLVAQGRPRDAILAGLFAALGHLTRADGLLLVVVAGIGAFAVVGTWRNRFRLAALIAVAYLVGMSAWFARNIDAIGAPLPTGGTEAFWYDSYNDLFNYPPGASPESAFEDGPANFVEARRTALSNNILTLIAVEGMVIITPFMLIGLWNRRRERFLWPFALYALGLHLAMTFVFPFAGYRGALFHSSAALIAFWMALGVVGLDDVVDWIAARRHNWKPIQAKRVFSAGFVFLALYLSYKIAMGGRVYEQSGPVNYYARLAGILPDDAVVMVNDPTQLYYYTGNGGVVIPNAPFDSLLEIAEKYGVTHLLLETGGGVYAVPEDFIVPEDLPAYLIPVEAETGGGRLYVIAR